MLRFQPVLLPSDRVPVPGAAGASLSGGCRGQCPRGPSGALDARDSQWPRECRTFRALRPTVD